MQARLEDNAQCLLVIIGATPEGKKELVGLIDGVRESTHSWRELLLDLRRRGLAMAPELAVADGALGFWKAMLAFYDFPAEHWKHLRTSNPIESTFATVRHRAPSNRAIEGMAVQQNRARHDLQARPGS